MVELNFNLLYANGDSWTAGDIVDPELFGNQLQHSMHPDNAQYRYPRVWPHKLGKMLNVETINNSHSGASNDRIVRTTINDITKLVKLYNPHDMFVLIGWSSPERKDFFYRKPEAGHGVWDCLYPAELKHWKDEADPIRNNFYKNYVLGYWHEEEYITRHIMNVLFVHNFLKNLGIKHLFFDCFYEKKEAVLDNNRHQLYDQPILKTYIEKFASTTPLKALEFYELENTIEHYLEIYEKVYIKETFVEYLKALRIKEPKHNYLDFHPTELGHEKWAEYLYKNVFKQV